ncbi:MAG: hypothetical protein ACMXYE_00430 [Candidatus Woesearchaeota archaeon]
MVVGFFKKLLQTDSARNESKESMLFGSEGLNSSQGSVLSNDSSNALLQNNSDDVGRSRDARTASSFSIIPHKQDGSDSALYYNYMLSRFERNSSGSPLVHDNDVRAFSRISTSALQSSQMLSDLEAEWKQIVDERDMLKKKLSDLESDIVSRSDTIKQLIQERSGLEK